MECGQWGRFATNVTLTEIFPIWFHNLIAKPLIDGRIVSSRWDVRGSDATRGETARRRRPSGASKSMKSFDDR
ncbi:hypothetical protein [Bradyrhizobium acaciae]|uniref:hypothetical protein n=1 Tax=Bradyrhizobium acaciae TaxID=2683706 RepID=UPI001E5D3E2A|nr:hypothetical protein [Bradyrhizobium acaciae]MCC8982205.1 hypothetical protein [Bradyrhizobium acaciae]